MSISKKDQIAYWSSEEFLNQYFNQLKFNEPYSKATGSIAGQWVRNPWTGKIRGIVFKFVKSYVKKHHQLPEGEHKFKVNWGAPNAKWLKDVLLKEQVVTFSKLKKNLSLNAINKAAVPSS
jgi:hypothetical protein